jgi:hypothetical protein
MAMSGGWVEVLVTDNDWYQLFRKDSVCWGWGHKGVSIDKDTNFLCAPFELATDAKPM